MYRERGKSMSLVILLMMALPAFAQDTVSDPELPDATDGVEVVTEPEDSEDDSVDDDPQEPQAADPGSKSDEIGDTPSPSLPADDPPAAEDEVESVFMPPASSGVDVSRYLPTESALRPRVMVGVFADFGLYFDDDFQQSQLTLGQLVVHSTATLSPAFSTFVEVTLNSGPQPYASVERLLFNWERSDAIKFSAGRHHLPVTWWNTTMHHGTWLQTTSARPRMLSYGSSFIPNHAMGLFASGQLPLLRSLGVRYEVGVSADGDSGHHVMAMGTGTTGTTGTTGSASPGVASDAEVIEPMVNGVLAIEPRAIPHLRIGISGVIRPDEEASSAGRTNVGGAHFVYASERPELIIEGVLVAHHHDMSSHRQHHATIVHMSGAGYAQLAWRLSGSGERFKPYTRVERDVVQAKDPNLQDMEDYLGGTAGLRIDFIPTLALKLEATKQLLGDTDDYWSGAAQVSAAW